MSDIPTSSPSPVLTALVQEAAPLIHSDRLVEAGRQIAASLNLSIEIREPHQAQEVVRVLVYKCLYDGHLALAAQLLWPPSFFTPEPREVQKIWRNMSEHSAILLMGAASMSKTYTPGVMLYLEWQRDPEFTNVICVGPSEEHLEANLFSHLVKLHQSTSIPMPGTTGKRWIGLDTRNKRAGIRGVVIPVGKAAAGRIQGTKRHPRPREHPIFGKLSRLFLLLDELENVPAGVYSDIENVLSTSGEEASGFKIIGAYNPKDVTLRPYQMAEPECGWKNFDPETDEEWTSKLDWRVVRLDAAKSANVVSGTVIFSGLQTKQGYDKLVKASGGVGSPGYWTFGRGCYPPSGSSTSAIPAHLFDQQVAEVVFIEKPTNVSGADLALEGGDHVKMGHGWWGRASGVKRDGVFEPFLSPAGRPITRMVLQYVATHPAPKGDTLATAANVKRLGLLLGVRPQHLCLDRTGNGSGVHDLLKGTWSPEILGVNYSQSPTKMRVMEEDAETGEERFPRIDSELIMATRDWLEYGYLWIHPDFDLTQTREQLSKRKVSSQRGKQQVQSKKEYKDENQGKSPDDGDAFCLTVHLVRVRFTPALTMSPDKPGSADDSDDFSVGTVDITNQLDDID